MKRIDSMVVRLIITEYDEAGVAIGDAALEELKVFRSQLATFLERADAELAKNSAETVKPKPKPKPKVKT